MAISYNKLWKLLVDKKMSKADLRKAAGIAYFHKVLELFDIHKFLHRSVPQR